VSVEEAFNICLLSEVDSLIGSVSSDSQAKVVIAWTKVGHFEAFTKRLLKLIDLFHAWPNNEEVVHVDSNEGVSFDEYTLIGIQR
jgi:hypothetical protein